MKILPCEYLGLMADRLDNWMMDQLMARMVTSSFVVVLR